MEKKAMVGSIMAALKHEWEVVRGGGATWFSVTLFLSLIFLFMAKAIAVSIEEEKQRERMLAVKIRQGEVSLECSQGVHMVPIPVNRYHLIGSGTSILVESNDGVEVVSLKACRELR